MMMALPTTAMKTTKLVEESCNINIGYYDAR